MSKKNENDDSIIEVSDLPHIVGCEVGGKFQTTWNYLNSDTNKLDVMNQEEYKFLSELNEKHIAEWERDMPFPIDITGCEVDKINLTYVEVSKLADGVEGNFTENSNIHITHKFITLDKFKEMVSSGEWTYLHNLTKDYPSQHEIGHFCRNDSGITLESIDKLMKSGLMKHLAKQLGDVGDSDEITKELVKDLLYKRIFGEDADGEVSKESMSADKVSATLKDIIDAVERGESLGNDPTSN